MQIIDEVVESIISKPRSGPECIIALRKPHRRVRRVLAHIRPQTTAGAHHMQQTRGSTVSHSSAPSTEEEEREWDRQLGEIEEFMYSARFRNTVRYHTAKDVLRLSSPVHTPCRGAVPAQKLYDIILKHSSSSTSISAVGCIDPVQAVLLAPHCEAMYVSGWQTSITAAADNHTGPDLADYPYTSVPAAVERVVNAQEWHARVQRQRRMLLSAEERQDEARVDYFRPVLADADTGHGSLSSLMRLTRLLIDAGAAGIHIEDQTSGITQISGFSGKTLVSLREAEYRLRAARLQCDISRAATVLVARTDAAEAVWLASDADEREHRFIVGVSNPRSAAMHGELLRSPRLMRRWERAAALCTYPQCVRRVLEAMVEEREEAKESGPNGAEEPEEYEEEEEETDDDGEARSEAKDAAAERGGEKKGANHGDGAATPDKERDLEELREKRNSTAELRRGNATLPPSRSTTPSAPSRSPALALASPSSPLDEHTHLQDKPEDLTAPRSMPASPAAGGDVDALLQAWDAFVETCPSITHMRAFAAKLLREKAPYWSPEHAKNPDGHFRVIGGQEYAIFRAKAFSGLADMVWVHTSVPSLSLSLSVMSCTRITHPHTLFLHSFPPSHNWHAVGLTDAEVPAYTAALEAEGAVLLLVPQGGFHVSAMAAQEAGSALERHGTLGFVRAVQRREQSLALPTLSHHQWSGAVLAAAITGTATALPMRAPADAADAWKYENKAASTVTAARASSSLSPDPRSATLRTPPAILPAAPLSKPTTAPLPSHSTEPRDFAGVRVGAGADMLSTHTDNAGDLAAHVTAPWDIGVLLPPAVGQAKAVDTRNAGRGSITGLGVGTQAVDAAMTGDPAALLLGAGGRRGGEGEPVDVDGVDRVSAAGWVDEEWLPALGIHPGTRTGTRAGLRTGVAAGASGAAAGGRDQIVSHDAGIGVNTATRADTDTGANVGAGMSAGMAAPACENISGCESAVSPNAASEDDWRSWLGAESDVSPTTSTAAAGAHSGAGAGSSGAEQPWGWARSNSGRGGWRTGRISHPGEEAFMRALE